jgi:aspartyl-tRNA synthetase
LLNEEQKKKLIENTKAKEGDLIVIVKNERREVTNLQLGRIRVEGANIMKKREIIKIDPKRFDFLWIVDFPLFSIDEQNASFIHTTHHPFTAPSNDHQSLLFSVDDPSFIAKNVNGQHYDIVKKKILFNLFKFYLILFKFFSGSKWR